MLYCLTTLLPRRVPRYRMAAPARKPMSTSSGAERTLEMQPSKKFFEPVVKRRTRDTEPVPKR